MTALDGINFPRREPAGSKARARHQARQIAQVTCKYSGNPTVQVGNPAMLIACQRNSAPPPVAAYEAWLAAIPTAPTGRRKVTGSGLRRAVVMLRDGYNIAEIERATGHTVRTWLAKLPPELRA